MFLVKKGSSRVIHLKENANGRPWAKRFFDKGIRSEKELNKTVEYIHNNPAKTGLAKESGKYPFSSANLRWSTDLELYFDGTEPSYPHLEGKVGIPVAVPRFIENSALPVIERI